MTMRCRPFVMGGTLVLGLACLAGVAQAGSGYVPAPQAIHVPVATAQAVASEQALPSAQGCYAPCGPVETGCHSGRNLFSGVGGCLSGLKCKLHSAGTNLKCKASSLGCGIKGGLGHMKGKLGGCFSHKRAVQCAPVCETGCGGEVWPSGQGVYAAPQGAVAAPQGYAAPQAASQQQ